MNIDCKLHEECAVFGVNIKNEEAAGMAYNALLAMQHRGQEGAGIAVVDNGKLLYHKNVGLISEVFTDRVLAKLPKSKMAVGHNRYSTTGCNTIDNVQPFVTEYLTGRIATVHNGNILNAGELKEKLSKSGVQFNATSDSEVISSLIAYYSMKLDDVYEGVVHAVKQIRGAFSLIVITSDNRLIAVRDGSGFRPLCIGKNEFGIAVASESCALDSSGFEFVRDVAPGEILVVKDCEIISSSIEMKKEDPNSGLCIFEYVYFARPDSIIDGLSVYEARYNMGKILAKQYPVEADVVCGVPDSGLEAAIGYSAQSNIPLVPGFVKNRYIGRSFIYPTQAQRESAVSIKLNPLKFNVSGKRIVLVDDSIVRGTTSAKIIKALKNAGAKEVHMRISSPPFLYTCHYGTDIDSEENLIANNFSLEEICKQIGADSLGYITIDGLKEACNKCNLSFCTKCFTGHSETNKGKLELEG